MNREGRNRWYHIPESAVCSAGGEMLGVHSQGNVFLKCISLVPWEKGAGGNALPGQFVLFFMDHCILATAFNKCALNL